METLFSCGWLGVHTLQMGLNLKVEEINVDFQALHFGDRYSLNSRCTQKLIFSPDDG